MISFLDGKLYLILAFVLIFILLLLSAFFSASETALTTVSNAQMRDKAKKGSKIANLIIKLKKKPDKLIATILFGNNLVNIFASTLLTGIFISWYDQRGIAYATIVMTFVVLIFAEILPKTYAMTNSNRFASIVAKPLSWFILLFSPITRVIHFCVSLLHKVIGYDSGRSGGKGSEWHEAELRGVIELHRSTKDPHIKEEHKMLKSVLDLDDIYVENIMTNRQNVAMIDCKIKIDVLVGQIHKIPYTRLPVYKNSTDNIIGILHIKELFAFISTKNGNHNWQSIITKPWFISSYTTLLEQLQEFKRRREHFAVIVNEYGGFEGIVTLEDILEEIVGEIEDEYDKEDYKLTKDKDGFVRIPGNETIRDINRELEWDISDDNASTISGYIMHESERIPDKGQVLSIGGYRFIILDRKKNIITWLKVAKEISNLSPQEI